LITVVISGGSDAAGDQRASVEDWDTL